MSDDHPFGPDTLVIPFRWQGAAPVRRRVVGMSRMRPAGQLFGSGVVRETDHTDAPLPDGTRAMSASSVSLPDIAEQNEFLKQGRYIIQPPVVVDAPYQIAAIDYDPRDVRLTPEAEAVEAQIMEVTREVVRDENNKFDSLTVQGAASQVHAELAKRLRARAIPGVSVETPMDTDGEVLRSNKRGSVRPDVVYRNLATGEVEAMWDYKIGDALLTASRAKQLAEYADGVRNTDKLARRIPVKEIRVDFVPDR